PAVIQGERQVSFRDFRRRVDTLAGGLLRLGIGQGDRICVLAQNDPAYLELYGACARQGIIAYPINWRLTAQEVERVVERAAPRMMVVDATTVGVIAGWPETKRAIAHWYQLGGSPGAGLKPFDSLYRATGGADAAEKLGSGLQSLKHVSGLDAPPTIQRLHESTGAQFWTGFGQSETSGFVSFQRVLDRPGAAGKPVPLAQVKVVDDYDRDVPVGTPGEIVVRGPLVFQGYFDQPEVTAYTFRNG